MIDHGISVGVERINSWAYLRIKAWGNPNGADYKRVLPLLEDSLEGIAEHHAKALVDVRNLEQSSASALWEEFKFGIRHQGQFAKVAVLGDEDKMSWIFKAIDEFTSAEVEYFDSEAQTLAWLEVD